MTRQEAIERLKECQKQGDPEAYHMIADNILCEFLTDMGYEDVVSEWRKVEAWYA